MSLSSSARTAFLATLFVLAPLLAPLRALAGVSCIDYGEPAMHRISGFGPGAWWRSVASRGDYLYFGTEGYIHVFDLSNPAAPLSLGTVPSGGLSNGILVIGDYAYVSNSDLYYGIPSRLDVFSLANPTVPAPVARVPMNGRAIRLAHSGSLLSVLRSDLGLAIVDISNPTVPMLLGELDLPYDYPRGLAMSSEHCYVARGDLGGMQVIDISDPQHPILVPGGIFETSERTNDVVFDGTYVYLACGPLNWIGPGHLRVIDVANPGAPVEVASVALWAAGTQLILRENLLFVSDDSEHMHAIDITDPTSPVVIGTADGGGGWGMCLHGDYLVGCHRYGVNIFDITSPVTPVPTVITQTFRTPNRLALSGQFACITGEEGLQIVDLAQPDHPVVGHLDQPHWAGAVATQGDWAVVGSQATLHVIDIHDPTSPVAVGSISGNWVHDVAADDSYAYVANGTSGLRVIDISNPALPVQVAVAALQGEARSVTVSDGYAYVGTTSGLSVVDVRNPTAPVVVGYGATPATVNEIAISGTHAYLAAGWLMIFDISIPTSPEPISHVSTPYLSSIAASDGIAYAGSLRNIYAVDVSDPESPVLLGQAAARNFGGLGVPGVATYGDFLLATTTLGAGPGEGGLWYGALFAFPKQCPATTAVADPLPTPIAQSALLEDAFPNPFAGTTSIAFDLPRAAPVTLTVYDAAGRCVRTLIDGQRPAGRHELGWDGRSASGRALSSGVYFLRLTHPGGAAETKALTLLR